MRAEAPPCALHQHGLAIACGVVHTHPTLAAEVRHDLIMPRGLALAREEENRTASAAVGRVRVGASLNVDLHHLGVPLARGLGGGWRRREGGEKGGVTVRTCRRRAVTARPPGGLRLIRSIDGAQWSHR